MIVTFPSSGARNRSLVDQYETTVPYLSSRAQPRQPTSSKSCIPQGSPTAADLPIGGQQPGG